MIDDGEGFWIKDPCGSNTTGYSGPLHKGFLHWSGDGHNLVFDRGDTLWVMNIEGGSPRMLADTDPDYLETPSGDRYGLESLYGFYADASPDGSKIVYSSCEFLLGRQTDQRLTEGYELVMMNVDRTEKTRLTRPKRLDHYPVWSPDGKTIAFVTSAYLHRGFYPHDPEDQDSMTLAVLDTEETSDIVVLAASRVALYPPVWSPDSRKLAYIANEGEDPWNPEIGIWTIGLDNGEPVRIADALSPPTWSPDGEELAFVSVEREKVVVNASRPDGTERREVWRGVGRYGQVLWSPDGSEILVLSDQAYLVSADGSEQRILSHDWPIGYNSNTVHQIRAAWSPDGTKIALRDSFNTSIVSRDGTELRVLAGGR